ncbi:MAG: hypothetical protein M1829_000731 [Trizodia sp. TS-e1964]|nr:MAG: hypothetical protein M1829_000731 [Trizodia sp. TS-e1964]
MPATKPALAPALTPAQAPEPMLNSIDDFSFSLHKIEQQKRVAHLAGGAGYSHYLKSMVALISHSKARKEPKLVDLSIKKEAWNEVKRFTAHFHREKKPDIKIQLKIHYKRRRQSACAVLASVDILSDPPAIKEQQSQRVIKCVQEGLDAAAAIREPGSENSWFLELVSQLKTKWKCDNKQCSNSDRGACAIFTGQDHSPLSLEDLRMWVQAIQAKQASLETAPHKLLGKKIAEIAIAKMLKKGATGPAAAPAQVPAPIQQHIRLLHTLWLPLFPGLDGAPQYQIWPIMLSFIPQSRRGQAVCLGRSQTKPNKRSNV